MYYMNSIVQIPGVKWRIKLQTLSIKKLKDSYFQNIKDLTLVQAISRRILANLVDMQTFCFLHLTTFTAGLSTSAASGKTKKFRQF